MDDAVRGVNVGNDDVDVVDHHAVAEIHGDLFALHGRSGHAIAEIRAGDLASHHVVGEDGGQCVGVFEELFSGEAECIERGSEGIVGGSEDRERPIT